MTVDEWALHSDDAEAVDELDVSDLWVQASLGYKQRLQALFFPEGIEP